MYAESFSTVPNVGQSSSGRSGKSSFIADGRIMAPESRCDPGPLPFSTSATGTLPSDSASLGSSSSSWVSLIAHASPAGPPPTMTTPTSIRSSSGSVGRPMNSFSESTGGANSRGFVDIGLAGSVLTGLDGLGELGQDLVQIAHHAEIGVLEDRGVRVLVD